MSIRSLSTPIGRAVVEIVCTVSNAPGNAPIRSGSQRQAVSPPRWTKSFAGAAWVLISCTWVIYLFPLRVLCLSFPAPYYL
jgi:hypothetical protein